MSLDKYLPKEVLSPDLHLPIVFSVEYKCRRCKRLFSITGSNLYKASCPYCKTRIHLRLRKTKQKDTLERLCKNCKQFFPLPNPTGERQFDCEERQKCYFNVVECPKCGQRNFLRVWVIYPPTRFHS